MLYSSRCLVHQSSVQVYKYVNQEKYVDQGVKVLVEFA